MKEEMKRIYTIDRKIAELENKLMRLKEKRKKYTVKDLREDYIGKYVLIRNIIDPPDIHKCMLVKDIFPHATYPYLISFTGKGFYYSDGDCPDERYCYVSESLNEKISKEQIENGDVHITVLTEEEYKEEMRKMMEFIRRTYEI